MSNFVKHDLIFSDQLYEWTESYISGSTNSVGSAAAVLESNNLAIARANLLGGGARINVVRQTTIGFPSGRIQDRRHTWLVYKSDQQGTYFYGPQDWQGKLGAVTTADSPVLSAKVRLQLDNGQFAIRYFGGLPDGVQADPNEIFLANVPSAEQRWLAWAKYITGPAWGIRQRDKSSEVQFAITAITRSGLGDYFQAAFSVAPGFNMNLDVAVAGVKMIDGTKSPFNGVWRLRQMIDATHYVLDHRFLVPQSFTTTQPGGAAANVAYQLNKIIQVNLQTTTHRKRGNRGTGEPRGKAAKR